MLVTELSAGPAPFSIFLCLLQVYDDITAAVQASLDRQHGKVAETEGALAAEEAVAGDKVRPWLTFRAHIHCAAVRARVSSGKPSYWWLRNGCIYGFVDYITYGWHLRCLGPGRLPAG